MKTRVNSTKRKRSLKRTLLWVTAVFLIIIVVVAVFVYNNFNRLLSDALIKNFNSSIVSDVYELKFEKLSSPTPIQIVIVPGNEVVKAIALQLQEAGFDIRPILYPTVPLGKERLRIVLHAYNTMSEVEQLVKILS